MSYVFNDPIFNEDEYENKLLLHKPKFQGGVQWLRKKWGIPDEGFTNNKTQHDWFINLIKKQQYNQDVTTFLRFLDLTDRWHSGVSAYIQTNAPNVLRTQSNFRIKNEYDEDGEPILANSIWLKVDADTTQREIIDAFKNARGQLRGITEKKQKPINLDRDLEVYYKHQDGIKKH